MFAFLSLLFAAGRAELAPQIVQEVEDVAEFSEDIPSGLMTASENEQSATHKTIAQSIQGCVYHPGFRLIV